MEVMWNANKGSDIVKLGSVQYGEVFELPGQGHILIKIAKCRSAKHNNMTISWTPGYCLAFNPKHGTVRALSGDTEVRVLESSMSISRVECRSDVQRYLKKERGI